jgi:hypothetical protein
VQNARSIIEIVFVAFRGFFRPIWFLDDFLMKKRAALESAG